MLLFIFLLFSIQIQTEFRILFFFSYVLLLFLGLYPYHFNTFAHSIDYHFCCGSHLVQKIQINKWNIILVFFFSFVRWLDFYQDLPVAFIAGNWLKLFLSLAHSNNAYKFKTHLWKIMRYFLSLFTVYRNKPWLCIVFFVCDDWHLRVH